MKFFFVGDFRSNTGPGIANKAIRKGLSKYGNILYSDANNRFSRVLEMIVKIPQSDAVCFCSSSKANIIGMKIAEMFNKKSFYIMHGYLTFESQVSNDNITEKEIEKINRFERYIFKTVDQVYCVSEGFMSYMKVTEPEFRDKFDYNYNGLDIGKIRKNAEKRSSSKNLRQIVSIGGGMKQKSNLAVCAAINKLNKERKMNLRYIVIGPPYTDKEEICSYDFVTYYDELPHERVLDILAESYLYIQNSIFETFGLALIEALCSKCNLLVSNTVGALGVIGDLENDDLIFDQNDTEEIARKIENIYRVGNASRLYSGLRTDMIDFDKAAKSLVEKMKARLT